MKTKTLESMILRMESEEIGKIRDDGVNDWNIVNTLMTQQHDEHITNVHDVASRRRGPHLELTKFRPG
jgi:hypothetical protein